MGDKSKKKPMDKEPVAEEPSYWQQMSRPRIITPKFDAEVFKKNALSSGVKEKALNASPTARVTELAKPTDRNVTKKFDPADFDIPMVNPSALLATTTDRIENLSLPTNRHLQSNLDNYKAEFPELVGKIEKYQGLQSKSDYNKFEHRCYESEPEIILTRSEMYKSKYKPKKVSPKKAQKELKKWVQERSKPKRQFSQEEFDRGPKKPLRELNTRMTLLAQSNPRNVTLRFSQQSLLSAGVKPNALRARSTRRTDELALPRWPEKKYSRHSITGTGVLKRALQGQASARVKELAEPKLDRSPPPRENAFEVSESAKNGNASGRVQELAKPSHVTEKYQKDEEFDSGVKKEALNAEASGRVSELAQPKEDKSPPPRENAYNVSNAALNAQASSRTKKLAEPKYKSKRTYSKRG